MLKHLTPPMIGLVWKAFVSLGAEAALLALAVVCTFALPWCARFLMVAVLALKAQSFWKNTLSPAVTFVDSLSQASQSLAAARLGTAANDTPTDSTTTTDAGQPTFLPLATMNGQVPSSLLNNMSALGMDESQTRQAVELAQSMMPLMMDAMVRSVGPQLAALQMGAPTTTAHPSMVRRSGLLVAGQEDVD
jgi:hypothetical protein